MALRFYRDGMDMSYVGQILLDDFIAFSKDKNIMTHEGCNYKFKMTFEQMQELVRKKINRRFKFIKAVDSPYYTTQATVHQTNGQSVTVVDNGEFVFLQPDTPVLSNASHIDIVFNGVQNKIENFESIIFSNNTCPVRSKYEPVTLLILIIVIFIIISFTKN